MSFDLKWFCCSVNSPDTLSLSLTLSANVACIPETHVPAWKILVVSEATYLRLFEGGCLWSFDLKWFCCMVNSPRHSLSISHAFRKCCVYSRNSRARLENSSGQGGDLSTSIRRRMSLECSGTLNLFINFKYPRDKVKLSGWENFVHWFSYQPSYFGGVQAFLHRDQCNTFVLRSWWIKINRTRTKSKVHANMTESWLHKDFTNACLENMLVTAELENCSPLAWRGGGNFLNSIFLGQNGTSDSFRGVIRAVR